MGINRSLHHGCCALTLLGILALSACNNAASVDSEAVVNAATRNQTIDNALRSQSGDGFALLFEPQALAFPADHMPHADYRTEWWYITGNLDAADGRRFGFQATWFRQGMTRATDDATQAADKTSVWASHDAWMGHMGVSDVRTGTFHQAHDFARGAAGLAGAQQNNDGTTIFMNQWQLHLHEYEHEARMQLHFNTEHTEVILTGTRVGPTVLRGEQGLSQKSATPGNASMYYVWPRIQMQGHIHINGEKIAVSGQAWMDREWGSSLLDADQAGWDWFALHLNDGSNLMVYSLRRKDGGIDPYAVAHRTTADGSSQRWQPSEWTLTPLSTWTSPVTGSTWPISWRLQIPSIDFDATVRAVFPNQEHHGAFSYWEGTVDVTATNGNENLGRGYLEMTGH